MPHSVDLLPDADPYVQHRAVDCAKMSSASFKGFDMVVMISCNTYWRHSIFKYGSDGLEFRARCGPKLAFE